MTSSLSIYQAAAGSGKTFQLTIEYLTLLFRSPKSYRHILAVTFTNKATAEMKERILATLDELRGGDDTPYLAPLIENTKKSGTTLREEAGILLSDILHHYTHFSISTIDQFFQQVLRAFAKDMGINGTVNLELDNQKVLDESIQDMLSTLDDNPQLQAWLVDMADSQLKQGKAWHTYRHSFLSLGKELFSDAYTGAVHEGVTREQLQIFIKELREICETVEEKMTSFAQIMQEKVKQHNLSVEDFSYKKRGFMNYFWGHIPNKNYTMSARVIEAENNVDKWCSKTSKKKEQIQEFFYNGGNQVYIDTLSYYKAEEKRYQTSRIILKEINHIGVVNDLKKAISKYRKEHNTVLLSDTLHLIKTIINGNDTPFIYEKVGTRFSHYMLDEFQDTSHTQWYNFLPLIQHSLSLGKKSLLVGDTKQAIYRWRNSDWQLLGKYIQEQFPDAEKITLQNNWRSKENVVKFNNLFFRKVALFLQEKLNDEVREEIHKDIFERAYNNLEQIPSLANNPEKGSIEIDISEEKDPNERCTETLDKLTEKISLLRAKGFEWRDIAILVRRNIEGQEVANHLLQGIDGLPVRFISNDSLFIKNAASVRFIVAILNCIHHQNHIFYHSILEQEYRHLFSDKFVNLNELLSQLPQETQYETTYNTVEYIIDLFQLYSKEEEVVYLNAFLDAVLEYETRHTIHLAKFLEWWKQDGSKRTISVLEEENAIRILTIHKAKGLEFKAVLIPFADWKIDSNGGNGTMLWGNIDHHPFNQVSPIPIKYQKELENTFFAKEYYEEKAQTYIDCLNLMYVAFTRAKDYMWINTYLSPSDKQEKLSIGRIIKHCISTDFEFLNAPISPKTTKSSQPRETPDFLLKKYESHLSQFSGDYIPAPIRTKDSSESGALQRGVLIHDIFSKISVKEDCTYVVDHFQSKGIIDKKTALELKVKVPKMIDKPLIRDWFSGQWRVRTELTVLVPNQSSVRLDRVLFKENETVIVEIKTGLPRGQDKEQVRNYIRLIEEAGYPSVVGYVWYTTTGNVEIVKTL